MRRVGRSITMIPPQDASRVAFLVLLQTGSPRPAGLGWGGGDGAGRGGGGTSQCWVIQVEPSQEPVALDLLRHRHPCSRVPPQITECPSAQPNPPPNQQPNGLPQCLGPARATPPGGRSQGGGAAAGEGGDPGGFACGPECPGGAAARPGRRGPRCWCCWAWRGAGRGAQVAGGWSDRWRELAPPERVRGGVGGPPAPGRGPSMGGAGREPSGQAPPRGEALPAE